MLGMSPGQLGIITELAARGGTATTGEILASLHMRRGQLVHDLANLEDQGYVTADRALGERERVKTSWTLETAVLHADLQRLITHTTIPQTQS